MPSVTIQKVRLFENSAAIFTARLVDANNDGAALVPADIDTLTLRSYDITSDPTDGDLVTPAGATGTYTGTALDPDDVILDALDIGYLADGDQTGINCVIPLDGSYWPTGGHRYRIELHVVPVAGDSYYEVWEVDAQNVFSE